MLTEIIFRLDHHFHCLSHAVHILCSTNSNFIVFIYPKASDLIVLLYDSKT